MYEQFFFLGVGVTFLFLYIYEDNKFIGKNLWAVVGFCFVLASFFNNTAPISSSTTILPSAGGYVANTIYTYGIVPGLSLYGYGMIVILFFIIVVYMWKFLFDLMKMWG